MTQIPAHATVVVMLEPINFRAGIAAIARLVLERDPMGGALFVFRNRRGHMLRVLVLCFDGAGFWLCTKRLSKGCFTARRRARRASERGHEAR